MEGRLEDGVPVDCRSNLVHETLSRFMVSTGRLETGVADDAFRESVARSLRFGDVLIDFRRHVATKAGRPVDLSAREFFCHEEFRLNQMLSPDIYVAVLPIVEVRGRLGLGGRGRVIDYCLMMRELPQDCIMTEQLKKGHVTFEHIDQIARSIADFHYRGREDELARAQKLESLGLLAGGQSAKTRREVLAEIASGKSPQDVLAFVKGLADGAHRA